MSFRSCSKQKFSGLKPLTALLVAGLLSSCASLQEDAGAPAPAASAPAAATPAPAPAAPAPAAAQAPGAAADEPEDSGINRDGEIVELERFAETPPQVEPPENNVVELNYEQEDLRLIIERLGDELDLNMIIDPTIDDRVSLRTSADNPLAYEDIWPLLRLLARNAGITIEQSGNVYEFRKNDSDIPVEIVMPEWLNDATSSVVLQVTPLVYISVQSALEILNPMIQPEGSAIRLGTANLIGISGTPSQLNRVNAMLDVIDTDPFQNRGIRLYELLNSQAGDVAEELTTILRLIGGENSSYQVQALERVNSVLVVAPATRGFEEVTRWIRVLDADSREQVEQVFYYKVKNLNAANLAGTLSQVFQQDEDALVRVGDEAEPEPAPEPGEAGDGTATPDSAAATGAAAGNSAAQAPVSANISVTIVADADTNSLLIRGTPREYRQLLTTISELDTIPQQVLISAVIGQVTLNDSNEFGVDWTRVSTNAASGPAQLTTRFLPGGLFGESGPAQGSGMILTRTFADSTAIVDATLRAIAQDNEVRLLARPSLTVTNNQEGDIKVGQEVPIDTGSTVTGQGNVVANIAYRDVGIVLTITPHINDDGFVNLEIFQSLSSIEENSDGVAGNPIFTNQEITTTAVVSDQSTIILGGLIQEEDANSNNGVPGFRRIPLLGGLFSYQQGSSSRRELFVILRPQIIRGDGSDTAFMQDFRNRFENVAILMEEAGL
ncbi:MAG: type II secretion system secretin GspD [Pseudohongiellaceae bacterium]